MCQTDNYIGKPFPTQGSIRRLLGQAACTQEQRRHRFLVISYQGVLQFAIKATIVANEEILKRLGQVRVLEMVKKRQEEWKGRVEGIMDMKRFTSRVFEGVVEERRPRGRPRLRWMDNFR